MTELTCSYCGEDMPQDVPHDDLRCETIAWALADAVGKNHFPGLRSDEPGYNIVECSRWLRNHPQKRGTAQYLKREASLNRWIMIAQTTGALR